MKTQTQTPLTTSMKEYLTDREYNSIVEDIIFMYEGVGENNTSLKGVYESILTKLGEEV